MSRGVRLQRLLLLALAMGLATVAVGWLGPLLVAVIFAAIDRYPSVAAEASAAAAIAWGLLFIANALVPGADIIGVVARAMGIPSVVLPLVTILFPALLAWSGATVTVALSSAIGRGRHVGSTAPSQVAVRRD